MTLKLFNSFGNKLEEFKPLKKGKVSLYTCGPTVYNYAHVGNFRAYAWEDILRRYLEYKGFEVKHVMNFTDVDDKTIKGSSLEKIPLSLYTEKYKKAFLDDIKAINILPASVYTPATEYIKEMVDLILVLLKKGVAYRGEDGCIYFSIKKFPAYGKLAGIDVKKLKEGARVKQDEYEKEGVGDFALWKAWDENDGAVFWETPLGKGRPGWHIECSAMSMKQFGPTIDIHTGGIDNKFPHHENEIAQSEAATGKKFVNYWMHCAHLMVNNQKMSKSLRNFYTLRDVLNKGCDASAVRYVLINSSYRQPINFTFESVEDAKKTLAGLNNFVERLRSIKQDLKTDSIDGIVALAKDGFDSSMDNDLNVPEAVKHIFDFVRKVNKLIDENAVGKNSASQAIGFLKKVNSVLAVIDFSEKFFELTDEQRAKIVLRNTARKNKDWKKSDQLRDELKKDGIELKDNKDGSTTVNDSLVV